MTDYLSLVARLPDEIRIPLADVLSAFKLELAQMVTKEDFAELKKVVAELSGEVKELAQAQKRTEERVDTLALRVEELAQAQKRTEERVEELAQAQKRTEERVEELAQAQKRTEEVVQKLAQGLGNLRREVGGLSQSFSYAFENEAYKALPAYFEKKFGIKITERFVREEVDASEINFLARGKKGKKVITLVGEAKLRLKDKDSQSANSVFEELEEKVEAVRKVYAPKSIQPFLVTHYASKTFLKKAKRKGIPVIQSFEF